MAMSFLCGVYFLCVCGLSSIYGRRSSVFISANEVKYHGITTQHTHFYQRIDFKSVTYSRRKTESGKEL